MILAYNKIICQIRVIALALSSRVFPGSTTNLLWSTLCKAGVPLTLLCGEQLAASLEICLAGWHQPISKAVCCQLCRERRVLLQACLSLVIFLWTLAIALLHWFLSGHDFTWFHLCVFVCVGDESYNLVCSRQAFYDWAVYPATPSLVPLYSILVSKLWSSCLNFPSYLIISICHHT